MLTNPPRNAIDRAVDHLVKRGDSKFEEFLTGDVTFVPCPKSAPLPPNLGKVLWVPRRICEALRASGYGTETLPCLSRVEAVSKSAFAPPGDRPSIRRHYETMEVDSTLVDPRNITIIDDVVTKGATLLAAASLLANAFPDARVRAFALVRTMGLVPDIERIVEPVVGRIGLDAWGEPIRDP